MRSKHLVILAILLIGISLVFVGFVSATPAQQSDADEELIEQGRYLVQISGCDVCHTPALPEYEDFANLTLEQIQTIAFNDIETLDTENRYMAGGRVFDLGPAGIVVTRNLTPDEETGLGAWTDEEIRDAITLGISRDGHQLLPLMPYFNYNQMAEPDVDAVIAFLRSLEPVENDVGPYLQAIPALELQFSGPEEAPDPENELERGAYLLTGVLTCTDCHTPLDPETFEPDFSMFLAGGQPFEGPWGIVYGGNITPHEETGIGSYTEADLALVLSAGIMPDGRRTILMPWYSYTNLTPEDLRAVVTFLLEGLEPIDNEIPEPAVEEPFQLFADEDE
jgi:mono/diheme cytochrome c family protein